MSVHPAVLRPAERLARSAPSELEDARRSVITIIFAARTLAAQLPTGPHVDPVWDLAQRLAGLPTVSAGVVPSVLLADADAAFRDVLVHAIDAVRTCRQTLHVSGACWFADVPGTDGCGEVLRTAHALS